MGLVIKMNTFQIVHCTAAVFLIIVLLTEKCYSRDAKSNVQFILSEQQHVKFVKKLLQPQLTVQLNNNKKFWDLDFPLDVLEDKYGSTQQESPSSEYLKIEGDNNSNEIIKNRVSRQINNGYSSIYPSLPTFNPNAQNIYSTPYKTPGPQYNGYSFPTNNPYNPSNGNSYNDNRFSQNYTFQANVPSLNYSSRPSHFPYNQNFFPNNYTNPQYSQNNWYNQSSARPLYPYNAYNNAHNYSVYSNKTNFNSGFRQPNYNIYNTSNGYNFSNGTRNNPFYNSAQSINGSFYSQTFRSPNYSSPSYPTYKPSMNNTNFRSNYSWIPNYSQNAAFNPYYHPKNQTYSVNPTYVYNSSYSNYRNQQPYNQNNYYNNPQNNSYFTANKNQFNNPIGGATLSRPYQNNFPYLNQSSYIPTTPVSTPNFRPNMTPQNNFGGPNQSYLTEPNHFFYTPGGNNINSTNYNLPHKYYK